MTLLIQSRRVGWFLLLTVSLILATAWAADWLAHQRGLGPESRLPAVALGTLLSAISVAALVTTADEDLEGSTPHPPPAVIVGAALTITTILAATLVLFINDEPFNRGGVEAARNVIGLVGLSLFSAALAGNRLTWLLPFGYLSLVYFTAPHNYDQDPA